MHAPTVLSLTIAQLYRDAAASSRPHARCGSVVARPRNTKNSGTRRASCAGVVLRVVICACGLICGHTKDRARQETQSRRQRGHRDCPLDHPATHTLKSKPSLYVHSFLLAQSAPTKKKKMLRHRRVQQAQELEEAEASRGGVPPADTHSASAGSLSLHDTYCFMFFFLILSPLSVLPRHLLWPCGPSSAKRNIGQDSVCVRDFDCV